MDFDRIAKAERTLDRAVIALKLFADPSDLASLKDAQQIVQEVRHFSGMTEGEAEPSKVLPSTLRRLVQFINWKD